LFGNTNEIVEENIKNPSAILLLLKNGIISIDEVENKLADLISQQEISILELGEFFFLKKEDVLKKVAEKLKYRFIDLNLIDFNYKFASELSFQKLVKHSILPLNSFQVVVANPFDLETRDFISQTFEEFEVLLSNKEQIHEYLQKLKSEQGIQDILKKIRSVSGKSTEDFAIMELISAVLKDALSKRSSDIHIEPTEYSCTIRFRIDGVLLRGFLFEREVYPPLSSRLKLLSGLDIAERRIPQDGRFSQKINDEVIDFRVSTLPVIDGESIVIRILDSTKTTISLHSAGMLQENHNRFFKNLKLSHGIILVTGPTGSGKTTTLYGSLNEIKSVKDKIITVEEPVEYKVETVQQVNVNRQAGLDFANTLRAILRQDPDKIMVGEIRDRETLQIAIEASLTGHLVLSTLHTNDSISAINRMLDMGIESYLLAGSLIMIQAQRLVRKICPKCKRKIEFDKKVFEEDIRMLLSNKDTLFSGKGCNYCSFTGYHGREMICEVFEINEEISNMISSKSSKSEILEIARKSYGFRTIVEIGVEKATSGITTIDEVLRVARN
jgi:general secretion pathway protein E